MGRRQPGSPCPLRQWVSRKRVSWCQRMFGASGDGGVGRRFLDEVADDLFDGMMRRASGGRCRRGKARSCA